MSDFIRRDELVKILGELSTRYDSEARWNYDTIACSRLLAKSELCDDLVEALKEPTDV